MEKIIFRKGKSTILRPFTKEDAPTLARWMNDQETSRWLATRYPQTIQEEERWVEKREGDHKNIALAICTLDSKLIGGVGLHDIDHQNRTAITGSYLDEEEHRGKGYGTDAKMLLLHFAFFELDLYKINSRTYDFNQRSFAALKKQGYVVEGRQREQIYREGKRHDAILLALFRDTFEEKWRVYQNSIEAAPEFGTESNSSQNDFYGKGGI
jgi:RimJ/RimL family protein N-acetyltransferase